MEYNFEEIGRRFREYRERVEVPGKSRLKTSQEDFLAYMKEKGFSTVGRNTLSGIENGDPKAFGSVSILQWMEFCSVFGCSLGHLLGEYECRSAEVQAISDYTGLSNAAIDNLHYEANDPETMSAFSAVLGGEWEDLHSWLVSVLAAIKTPTGTVNKPNDLIMYELGLYHAGQKLQHLIQTGRERWDNHA